VVVLRGGGGWSVWGGGSQWFAMLVLGWGLFGLRWLRGGVLFVALDGSVGGCFRDGTWLGGVVFGGGVGGAIAEGDLIK